MLEKELIELILNIIEVLSQESDFLNARRAQANNLPDSLQKRALQAELKIRHTEIGRIKKSVLGILKRSTNKIILASVVVRDN